MKSIGIEDFLFINNNCIYKVAALTANKSDHESKTVK